MTLRQLPCGALLGLLLAAAGGAQGDSSLIIGTQLNPKDWDGMGMQVFFISSINGDAIPEIISSAHCTDVNGPLCGSISCYDGAADPVSGDHALIWRVDGDHARDQLGEIARNFGDADGDGFDDIMVAARLDDEIGPNAGSVRLLSGVDGQEILRVYPGAGGGLVRHGDGRPRRPFRRWRSRPGDRRPQPGRRIDRPLLFRWW